MRSKGTMQQALFRSGVLAAALAAPVALAVNESEPNQPVGSAESVTIVIEPGKATGGATIDAVLGVLSGAVQGDLDYFTFRGTAGDVVTLDIDGGMGGVRSVDTMLAIFGPAPAYRMLRFTDDGYPVDAGSIHMFDARIDNFKLPETGEYTVGVSSYPRRFTHGGGVTSNALNNRSNGDYRLLISGVSSPVLHISIDIKPGDGESAAPINPKSKGKIPVALLGAADFDVLNLDTASLTFGHTGYEASLAKCGPRELVNDDSYLDVVCHFENPAAAIASTDDEAVLRGKLNDGRQIEGRGWLKVVPVKSME